MIFLRLCLVNSIVFFVFIGLIILSINCFNLHVYCTPYHFKKFMGVGTTHVTVVLITWKDSTEKMTSKLNDCTDGVTSN